MAKERVQRRLAAILAADVVGYSRMMGRDEEGTLARLRTLREEFLHPQVAENGGRVVKTTGDGTLIEFGSAVEAVSHAIAVQRELAERNARIPDDEQIELRIGINVGDIIIEDEDIYGDGVNVAARLEPLADPGGICVSARVYDYIGDRLGVDCDDMGEQALKNIAEPIRVYRVHVDDGSARPRKPKSEAKSISNKPSIAVLPFENMSGDAEQDYFADGIAEDITTGLSRIRWFFVIARNSSFTYKGKAVDVRQVGQDLGVGYVLEGSVRRSSDRIRINAQLVDTATGNHLWAEKFDGTLADVFDLQDQITAQVVGAIEPSVRQAEIERSRRKHPENLDAYDLYLQALPHSWAHTPVDSAKALELALAAIDLDPEFGSAHGMVARSYQQQFLRAGYDPAHKKLSIDHARTVLVIGSDDSTALAVSGWILAFLDHDYRSAQGAVERALEFNPNSAQALGVSAVLNSFLGRHDQTIVDAEHSIRLNPFDPNRYIPEIGMCFAHFCCARYSEAMEAALRAIQSNPRFVPAHAMAAACQVRLGQPAEARRATERVLQIEPNIRFSVSIGIVAAGQPSDAENVAAALREIGLPE